MPSISMNHTNSGIFPVSIIVISNKLFNEYEINPKTKFANTWNNNYNIILVVTPELGNGDLLYHEDMK